MIFKFLKLVPVTVAICAMLAPNVVRAAVAPPGIEWEKSLGGSDLDWARSIQQTMDGGYIVAGLSGSPAGGDVAGPVHGGEDYWIVKLAYSTVTFNSQRGSAIATLTGVPHGGIITAPTPPTRAGYTFGGWYKEAACTNAWNFGTDTVTANITLYARWISPSAVTISVELPTGATISTVSFTITAADGASRQHTAPGSAGGTTNSSRSNGPFSVHHVKFTPSGV